MTEHHMKLTASIFFLTLFCWIMIPFLQEQGGCNQIKGDTNRTVTVDFDASSRLPAGLRPETTGHARYTAEWEIIPCQTAPSPPNLLKITRIKAPSGSQFNICWTDTLRFRNGSIEVRARADAGHVDQGGGPMWRVLDKNNYYVARLNPLEDNFRIYFVKKGRRVMIASADVHGIKAGQWFTIRIDVNEDRITGWVNGKKLIQVRNSTFTKEGGTGLWSKADAASSFDDLSIKISE